MPGPASAYVDVEDLDATTTLAATEALIGQRRALEVRDLELALHWADLHGEPPVPSHVQGRPRLTRLGGPGTPEVLDVSVCELAIARGSHPLAARSFLADALDLRHRLPRLYAAVREGRCDLWAARKVASMSRSLALADAALVDRAVTASVEESPGRLLGIAEAKVMEADSDQAHQRREQERRRRLVAVSRSDEHGLRTIFARVEAGDAVWLDAVIERVSDCLDARRDLVPDLPVDCDRDELRSVALGWLAHPEDVIALLAGQVDPEAAAEPRGGSAHRSSAVVYVHLHEAAVRGSAGLARSRTSDRCCSTRCGGCWVTPA